jgi:hypothetical protein
VPTPDKISGCGCSTRSHRCAAITASHARQPRAGHRRALRRAHLDTWDTYFGAAYTHGTPFRRAADEGLLDPESCLQVGIRGPLYDELDLEADCNLGFQVLPATDLDALRTSTSSGEIAS